MMELVHAKVEIEETAATITAERRFVADAVAAIRAARAQVERKIRKDRFFLTTMEPYQPSEDDEPVVKRMCESSAVAGVGPMAAIAGTIADEALRAMMAAGCRHCIVDNGGDIALLLDRPVTLEVFSNPDSGRTFGFEVEAAPEPLGICSSSGRLGHSISFGNADVALAIADDASLADALATAVGNMVRDRDSLGSCFDPFRQVRGARGFLAAMDGEVAVFGQIPRLVEVEHSPERMTVHSKMMSAGYVGRSQGGMGANA